MESESAFKRTVSEDESLRQLAKLSKDARDVLKSVRLTHDSILEVGKSILSIEKVILKESNASDLKPEDVRNIVDTIYFS